MLSSRPLLAAAVAAALASTAALVPVAAHADPEPTTTVIDCVPTDEKLRCGDAFYSLHTASEGVEPHAVLDKVAPTDDPSGYPTSFHVPTHVRAAIGEDEPTEWPVTVIGAEAFTVSYSTFLRNLTSITFAENSNVHTLGENAFRGTGITGFTVPDSVTTLEAGVWSKTASLTSIDFGDSQPTSIPTEAFTGGALESIEIPASVTVLEEAAFMDVPELRLVTFAEGSSLTTLEAVSLNFRVMPRGTLFLPDTVTTVAAGAIRGYDMENIMFTNADPEATLDIASDAIPIGSSHISVPKENADLYSALADAVASPASEVSLLSAKSYSTVDHYALGEVSVRHASREVFVNPTADGEPLPGEVMLSLGVVGGSTSVPTYSPFADGDQITITSRDKSTSATYTVRINRPVPPEATRHSGVSRFETACELTRAAMDAQTGAFEAAAAPEVVLSSGRSAFDTAIAGAMGAATDRVVLTVDTAEVPECTADLLVDIAPQAVHVIGGTSAVRDTVTDQLDELLPDVQVNRYAGVDRNATAEMVALDLYGPAPMMRTASGTTEPTIVLAAGDRPADVINVATYAAGYDMPVLTIPSDATELPESTLDAIEQLGAGMVMVVGGELAISKGVADQLDELGLWGTRIGGKTRYETSANIAEQLTLDGQGRDRAIIANGETFVDAAVAVAHTNTLSGPVVLTQRDCLPGPIHDQVMKSAHMHAVGGTLALGDAIDVHVARCQ